MTDDSPDLGPAGLPHESSLSSQPSPPGVPTHEHHFDIGNPAGERGTRAVLAITGLMMVAEVAVGLGTGSMALLADGVHMSTHALAIGVSAFAYRAARRLARDPRFAFGTWKIEVLGGFGSAVCLLVVALLMAVGSVERLVAPRPISYLEAVPVAILGLFVNVVSAVILGRAHHARHDVNLRAAYLHVLADAATSLLAIAALVGALSTGWIWLDPACGIAGAVLVAVWARNLLAQTGGILLDREMDHPVVDHIRRAVEALQPGNAVTDLHVWRVGRESYACAITLLTGDITLEAGAVREALAPNTQVVHTTVEIHHTAPLGGGQEAHRA
jgi:cation diffusion facilitator family transporter